ncbi:MULTISPECIES: hypothetical protein [Amycolatopsis]|uniref:Uncharacterized protein n=1 Tax=Amycolatopsis thermalba TaxID=944492 RepID=A0ABY4NVK6_9PSEU|nr:MULTISPECIES: hypothetical protein [Amycolatopsis]UQS24056.1 hypothetical protein L1857_15075 [Amycolatopsis thermalba]
MPGRTRLLPHEQRPGVRVCRSHPEAGPGLLDERRGVGAAEAERYQVPVELRSRAEASSVLAWILGLPPDEAPKPAHWTVAAIAELGHSRR